MVVLFGHNMYRVVNKTMRLFSLWRQSQIGHGTPVLRFTDHIQLDTYNRYDSSEGVVTRSRHLHNTQQRNIRTLSGIRTSDRAASDLRLRPQGHRERSVVFYGVFISQNLSVKHNGMSFIKRLHVTVHAFRDFRWSYTSVLYIYYSYYIGIT